jgi:putative DNA primase/helicase
MGDVLTLTALALHSIWVAWRTEVRNGLPTKVPYSPRTSRKAAANDPSTWATHAEAEGWAAMHGADGVGLVFTQIGDMVLGGIDLDTCRNPNTEAIEPWAQAVIDRFATYSEISPSGTGVKLYFAFASAALAAVEALFGGQTGRAFKNGASGDHPPAIEVYRTCRYFAVTRDALGGEEIRPVDIADLQWLLEVHGPWFAGPATSANQGKRPRAPRPNRTTRVAPPRRGALV